jgi:hypothetical protein
MHNILFNTARVVGPDRTGGGFVGIGGTHEFPIQGDGIITREHLYDDRS